MPRRSPKLSRDDGRYTVSGPGFDRAVNSPEIGISLALTKAMQHNGDATFYVRELVGGRVIGRVERAGKGARIYGRQHYLS